MKRISHIISAALAAFCFMACEGQSEEQYPVLETDKEVIVADGEDVASFTVFYDGEDVTADAEIVCLNDGSSLDGNSFSTTSAGMYRFEARYSDLVSEALAVTAEKKVEETVVSQFRRKICVMEFTGMWCTNCPSGYNYMSFVITNNRKYKDIAHIIALHDNTSGKDDFALPVQAEMAKAYNLTGYPSALIDMRDMSALNESFKKALDASLEQYTAHCGVAVSSVCDGGKATVTASVFSEKTANYRIAVYVVEDGLEGKQNFGGNYIDYTHNHVARRLVSATYKGDSLGEIEAGTEAEKTWEFDTDAGWNLDNTSIYALAIDGNGRVNNMAVCAIRGGDSGYDRL